MKTKEQLDFILVPAGLLLMTVYHLWLLHRIIYQKTKTVIGVNAIYRNLWIQTMFKTKNNVLAIQTLRNNLMASIIMASTSITLSSIIVVLMNNSILGGGGGGGTDGSSTPLVYGNDGEIVQSVKFFSIILCFLVAFLSYVESIRYYNHVSVLINVPLDELPTSMQHHDHDYVARCFNRGSNFWSLGMRAFYFSFPLFMWIFGPIPMFVCSSVMVLLLYFLDVSKDAEMMGRGGKEDSANGKVTGGGGGGGDDVDGGASADRSKTAHVRRREMLAT